MFAVDAESMFKDLFTVRGCLRLLEVAGEATWFRYPTF